MPRIYRHINEKRRSKGGDFKFAASEKKIYLLAVAKTHAHSYRQPHSILKKKTGRTLKDETLKKKTKKWKGNQKKLAEALRQQNKALPKRENSQYPARNSG